VLRDYLDGFISEEMAGDDYGVVIDVTSERVDVEATSRLRADRA
jgi:hypothetical protein